VAGKREPGEGKENKSEQKKEMMGRKWVTKKGKMNRRIEGENELAGGMNFE